MGASVRSVKCCRVIAFVVILPLATGGCNSKVAESDAKAELSYAVVEDSASISLPAETMSVHQGSDQNDGDKTPTALTHIEQVEELYLDNIKPRIIRGNAPEKGNPSVQDDLDSATTESELPASDLESEESKEEVETSPSRDVILSGDETISEEELLLDEEIHYGHLNDIPEEYHYLFEIVVPSESKNEVVVTSLDIQECVARGFVHNLSDTMTAKNVVVTLESLDGVDTATWHWPLSLMPGERAPFEIEVDWVPSRLPANHPDFRLSSSGMRNFWREPMGNLLPSVTADFSTEVDISRAFAQNVDGSRDPDRNFEVLSYTFDERLYGLEEWEITLRHTRGTNLMSEEQFDLLYPKSLTISDDFDTVLEELSALHYSDWYYIPSEVFPKHFNVDIHSEVTDIRIFYAATVFDQVLDVQELIPFQVLQEAGEGSMQRQIIAPSSSFIEYNSDQGIPKYVVKLRPQISANIVGPNPLSQYHRHINGKLWVGRAESRGPQWASATERVQLSGEEVERRGWPPGSCGRTGGLTRENYDIKTSVWADVFDATFGYFGLFTNFHSFPEIDVNVFVDPFSVSAKDGYVRGLIHNTSDRLFARDLSVNIRRKNGAVKTNTFVWPLTLQPGERAPFEIWVGGWEGVLPYSEFIYDISAALSERVDISRSFRIHPFANGSVYADETDAHTMENSLGVGDYISDSYLSNSYYHISLNGYSNTYGHISCTHEPTDPNLRMSEPVERTEVTCGGDDVPFGYVDLYAQISIPDSHPTLAGPISSQAISDLRAYVAIIDDNGVVSDVKQVTLFTAGYSKETGAQEYIPVNTIPAPNLLNPGGVRLLFTRPQFEESPWDEDYSYQVWIGGANEAEQ